MSAQPGQGWIPETVPDAPRPPPWVFGDWSAVTAAGSGFTQTALSLATAHDTLARLLTDTAQTLGWSGGAAQAAHARGGRTEDCLSLAWQALTVAGSAVTRFGQQGADAADDIRQLLSRRTAVVDDAGIEVLEAGRQPLLGGASALADPVGAERIRSLDARIVARVEDLVAEEAACARTLDGALRDLQAAVRAAVLDGWVESVAVPEVAAVLGFFHVLPDADQRALLTRIMGLPDTPQGVAQLRKELSTLTSGELEQLLLAHPELAARLTADGLNLLGTPGPFQDQLRDAIVQTLRSSGPTESAAVAELLSTIDWVAPPKSRIGQVRAWFGALPPEEARTIALLYPALVGNLDGVPLDLRVTANRVHVAAALHIEQLQLADRLRDQASQGEWEKLWSSGNDAAELLYAFSDDDQRARDAQLRIEYYRRLLTEQLPNPAARAGDPLTVGHQVLYFDPAGDGKVAEMFGTLDAGTRHVGLFVPGTSARMASADTYASLMAGIAGEDFTGGTATIMWMAFDAPDAVGANAPDPGYAQVGGPALRDFMWGLDVPSTADSTVIGHSYGGAVVGLSEKSGLETDRIVMVESAGLGADVQSLAGYGPNADRIQHYTMTAPGDPITYARVMPEWSQDVTGLGHGGDPDTTPGFTRLETGRYAPADPDRRVAGALIQGGDAHSGVLRPKSTAWTNLVGVIRGTQVTPWQDPRVLVGYSPGWRGTPTPVYTEHYAYADPTYDGPTVAVPPAGQQLPPAAATPGRGGR